ncbi:MAG TPA: LysR family transcriptional regulator [Terracidiphilus sp.]|nr:LysR family transcriptional regulator [Terracidiphilus sp.]
MDFEQLKTFQHVSRLKSFSRAAEKLGITQPAISAQIRSLEKEVGARLFDRDGGKVTFTAAGRLFEPFAEHCLQCHSHILVAVNELYRSARGEVAVAASEATSLYVLPRVFAQYKKQYSRVNLNIVRAEHLRSVEMVINREVDFAVVSLPIDDPRLVIQTIHRDDMVLVVAPNHPLATQSVVKLEETLKFPLLLLKQGRQRNLLNSFFSSVEAQPRIAMEVDSSELLKRLVCAELGMGYLPRANVLDDARAGLLKILIVEGMKLQRELALIYRKDRALTHAAQAFLEIAAGTTDPAVCEPLSFSRAER